VANLQALLSLKYEDFYSFLSFYSKIISVLHKLKKSKSIAVTDDVFVKAFFAKAISVDKLQGESKKLQGWYQNVCRNPRVYSLQLLCHRNRWAYKGRNGSQLNSLLSRRVLKDDGKKVNDAAHPISIFPHNVGGLLASTYYSQWGDWYSHMVIPEALWSDSSK